MAPRNRLDAGEEPYSRPAIGSGRVFRRLLSRVYRWRRYDPRVYRSLSRCEERGLCLRTSVRVHCLGQPSFHRMAADERFSAHRPHWIAGSASPRARSSRLETSVRQSAIHTTARVDVLRAERCLPLPETREGRTVSLGARMYTGASGGATTNRVVIQCGLRTSRTAGEACRSGEMHTRSIQNRVPARACGFESRLRHQTSVLDRIVARPVP